jgi:hypothetical protein
VAGILDQEDHWRLKGFNIHLLVELREPYVIYGNLGSFSSSLTSCCSRTAGSASMSKVDTINRRIIRKKDGATLECVIEI